MKQLVTYFSASGTTKKVAQQLSSVLNADLFEIEPKVPYTRKDLNWMDKKSRSSLEMKDLSSRPEIAKKLDRMDEYDVIFLGFPIWWYIAPTIINTFLESYDFHGKTIYLYATSGSSGFGKTLDHLKDSCPGANIKEWRLLKPRSDLVTLVKELDL